MKRRILFVDDDPNILQGLQRSLRSMREDWEMIFVSDSREALKEISNGKYDVIVSDYKMPGMDGLELLGKIKQKYPEVKRILLSGQSESEVFERADELEHEYIEKPCKSEEYW